MILRVQSEHFLQEIEARLGTKEIYVQAFGRHAICTAATPPSELIIWSEFKESVAPLMTRLSSEGYNVKRGTWSDTMDEPDADERVPFVLAVAYKSEGSMPGLWIDGDYLERSPSEVLKRMYDEFSEQGEIKETSFEEFVRVIHPNVIILPPHELDGFARKNDQML